MPTYQAPDGARFWFDTEPNPGTIRDDLVLMTDEEAAAADAAVSTPVPEAVSMRQARLALLGAGLLGAIDAAINSLPSPQKEAAAIEWDYASDVRRDSPLLESLAPALGLTDAQIDALFITAFTL